MKRCSTCHIERAIECFNKGGGSLGLQNNCRECQKEYQFARKWRPTPGKHRKKVCIACKTPKVLRNFYYSQNTADGYRNRCKQCMKQEAMEAYYLKYEQHLERKREHYQECKGA